MSLTQITPKYADMNLTINPPLPSHYVIPGLGTSHQKASAIAMAVRSRNKGKPHTVSTGIDFIILQIFDKPLDKLTQKVRNADIVFPRQVGTFLYLLAKASTIKAGAKYEKDHATAIHSRKKCLNILETKTSRNDYHNLVCAIRAFHMLYPQYSLSILPRGWDNPYIKIHKPLPGHGEQSRTVSAL